MPTCFDDPAHMDTSKGLSLRRRAKLVKRRTKYILSPLLLPAPLYLFHTVQALEVRFASVPFRSPCPILPARNLPTTLATYALYAAITQKVEADKLEGFDYFIASETQQVRLGLDYKSDSLLTAHRLLAEIRRCFYVTCITASTLDTYNYNRASTP
jgi:hypothetical protein